MIEKAPMNISAPVWKAVVQTVFWKMTNVSSAANAG